MKKQTRTLIVLLAILSIWCYGADKVSGSLEYLEPSLQATIEQLIQKAVQRDLYCYINKQCPTHCPFVKIVAQALSSDVLIADTTHIYTQIPISSILRKDGLVRWPAFMQVFEQLQYSSTLKQHYGPYKIDGMFYTEMKDKSSTTPLELSDILHLYEIPISYGISKPDDIIVFRGVIYVPKEYILSAIQREYPLLIKKIEKKSYDMQVPSLMT